MNRLLLVYSGLLALTLLSAFVAEAKPLTTWLGVAAIMAMGCAKFFLVVLEYMDMRKANRAWKLSVLLPAVLTALLVGVFALV